MANLQDLRRRVRSVRNMQKITKAMKMVAAARLAPRARARGRGSPLCQHDDAHAWASGSASGRLSSSAARPARRRALRACADYCGQGAVRRVQYQPQQSCAAIHPRESKQEGRDGGHRTKGARLLSPPPGYYCCAITSTSRRARSITKTPLKSRAT